ncbi:MAG: hypothetical protein ABIU54_12990 [Candidatus Eisenbacteria bacterium]
MKIPLWSVLVLLVVLAGCSAPRREDKAPSDTHVSADGWVRSGPVALAAEGDSGEVSISGIASLHSDSVTTIIVSFENASGAPVGHPAGSSVVFRPEVRVLRIQLPITVTKWSFTDKTFESGLVSRAFVVRRLDGSMALDLHLAQPASVRAAFGEGEAPLTVHLRRGGVALPAVADKGSSTVLLWPRPGDDSDTLAIEGYGRPFEANVEIHIRGAAPRDTFTNSADYTQTWGEFAIRLPRGARGPADTLLVGDSHMDTGKWLGSTVPLSRH